MAQWIKPGINIDFYGPRRYFYIGSASAIVLSIAMLFVNWAVRGQALNYGTDFKGGSQIQVQFSREVDAGAVRAALAKGDFKDAEVVRLRDQDRPNLFMLRLSEVSAFSEQDIGNVRRKLQGEFPQQLKDVGYKEGSDKIYLTFGPGLKVDVENRGKAVADRIEAQFKGANVAVQRVRLFGRAEDRRFEVQLRGLSEKLNKVFAAGLGKDIVKDIPQVETVGPKAGRQLRDDGLRAIVYTLLLILVYVAFRFDFTFAPGGVVALIHDVTITVGIFAVTWTEVSLPVVAALLTIAGYSINDTIVTYDRIRENLARQRDRDFKLIVNSSINQTLSRTLLTSLTVLFTCVAIWIFATGVVKTFAFALCIGSVVGVYSTVFIASPLVVTLHERIAAAKRKARA